MEGRAPTTGKAGAATPPADVPAGAPRTYLCRRLPLADHGRGRHPRRRLPGASGGVDPRPQEALARDGACSARRRPRPAVDRRRGLPADVHRRDQARRAQPREARPVRDLHDVDPLRRDAPARGQLGGLWEIARPFSFTASTVPVAAGGALAALAGAFDPWLFLATLVGAVALHVGTNVTNEIYDVRKGVDTIVSPRASHAIVKGRISERAAYRFAIAAFAVAVLVGLYLTSVRGWPIVALGIVGLVGGYTYTAPPFQYKFGPRRLPPPLLRPRSRTGIRPLSPGRRPL